CLETLYITGWNADYLQTFNKMLEREDLATELAPLRVVQQTLPLWAVVPQTPDGFDCSAGTWVLSQEGSPVVLDLVPRFVSLASGTETLTEGAAWAGRATRVRPGDGQYVGLLDLDRLHAELVDY